MLRVRLGVVFLFNILISINYYNCAGSVASESGKANHENCEKKVIVL